jgi:exodeoxyribonuclease (lambda-induced)
MIVYNCEQRSEEWYLLRLGKITGTKMKSLMSKEWKSIIDEVVSEILTQKTEEAYVNKNMQWGIDNEDFAVYEYEKKFFVETTSCGFCLSTKYKYLGLSPDGWVGYNGAIEVKCPSSKTHVKYIREDKIPTEYVWQIVNYFIVNENLEWLDFVSFDPRFEHSKLWVKRVNREDLEEKIKEAELMLIKAETEINNLLNKLKL